MSALRPGLPLPVFQRVGGSLALDLVNTVGNRLHARTRRDYFRSAADAVEWVRWIGLEPVPAGVRLTDRGLRRLVALREAVYRILAARAAGGTPARRDLDALSRCVAEAGARRRLRATANGFAWRWRAATGFEDRVLGAVALDAAHLLVSGACGRIRQCADDCCGWLFLDQTKGGRRRWCSMADCGNRAKARRHYDRSRQRRMRAPHG
jgi:predicted RNA-binding Zn ribbon-like protein